MRTHGAWRHAAIAAALTVAISCGDGDNGGGGGPMSPSPGPGPSGATITIGANGAVSPSQVTISVGQSVTFINNDTRSHDMSSDPHPSHTQCPAINVGPVAAGQTRLTNAFTSAGNCGFHDHNDPENAALKGTIRVQ